MKFSTLKLSGCLAAALLTLSAGAYSQTSQTFHFGEGDSGMAPGNAQRAPASQPAHQPATQRAKHHKRHHGHATHPGTYSHN